MNPNQIPELGRALRVIGEHGEALTRDAPADKLNEMREDLQKVLKLLDEVAGPKPLTRCKRHPFGAVDEDAPDLCLLCQTRRRRAEEQRKRDAGWERPSR
ncbi:hypothetical protein ACFV0T_26290 [Streptomyces sp. NPDC059582]|uniref:hypothetical protein n=1 Tax=Streptomyces sp. NPDC059582 TaxID=3346875 RepID=UPI0036B38223